MPFLKVNGKDIEIDDDGFIIEPEQWSEEFALKLAEIENFGEITKDHWKVIHYLREYSREHQCLPKIRVMCADTGFKLKVIYDLFPAGLVQGACKLAGLPGWGGCV